MTQLKITRFQEIHYIHHHIKKNNNFTEFLVDQLPVCFMCNMILPIRELLNKKSIPTQNTQSYSIKAQITFISVKVYNCVSWVFLLPTPPPQDFFCFFFF